MREFIIEYLVGYNTRNEYFVFVKLAAESTKAALEAVKSDNNYERYIGDKKNCVYEIFMGRKLSATANKTSYWVSTNELDRLSETEREKAFKKFIGDFKRYDPFSVFCEELVEKIEKEKAIKQDDDNSQFITIQTDDGRKITMKRSDYQEELKLANAKGRCGDWS